MVCVPKPANAGSKLFPLMPGPLKMPPEGEPVNDTGKALLQYSLASPLKLTGLNWFTVSKAAFETVVPHCAVIVL